MAATPSIRVTSLSLQTEYALKVTISQLAHPLLEVTKLAFKEIQTLLQHPHTSHFINHHVDTLLAMVATQLRNFQSMLPTVAPLDRRHLAHGYAAVVRLLQEVFKTSNITMTKQLSPGTAADLLHVLISTMLDDNLSTLDNGDGISKRINIIILKILETSNAGTAICGLIRLAGTTIQTSLNAGMKEIVVKCENQLLKLFPRWSVEGTSLSDSNIEDIIREFHSFNCHQPAEVLDKVDVLAIKFMRTIVAAMIDFVGLGRVQRVLERMTDLEGSATLSLIQKLQQKKDFTARLAGRFRFMF